MAVDDIRFRPAPQPQPTGSEGLARSAQRSSGVKVQPQSLRAPVDAFEGKQGRPAARAEQDAFARGAVPQRALWTEVRSGAGVDLPIDLSSIGLTQEDLVKAGEQAAPYLQKAAQAFLAGDKQGALAQLKEAAKAGVPDLAEKAILHVSQSLPQSGPLSAARALLTDQAFVHQLVNTPEGLDALGKIATGDVGGGVRALVANKPLRDAALDVVARSPGVQEGLEQLGFDASDLKRAGDAAPDVLDAAVKAAGGDFAGAMEALEKAAPVAQDLVVKGVNNAARKLPETGAEGIARSLLSDPAFVRQLISDPSVRGAVGQILRGDVAGGLRAIAGNDALTEAAINALATNKDVQAGMAKLGLTVDDLQAGRDALPDLVDAGMAAVQGDFKGALAKLGDAAEKAPEIVTRAVNTAAKNLLPNGIEGIAKSLLTDPKFVLAMVGTREGRAALKSLAEGKIPEALQLIASNDKLTSAAIDALARNPDVKAGMDKLGLTVADLQAGRDALPDLLDAAVAAGKGDLQGTFRSLQAAAGKAPEVVEKLIIAAAKNLPDGGVEGIVKSVLTDPAAVKQLVENEELHSAIGRLASGDLSALKDIALNEPARNAIADAVLNNPEVKAGLDKLGLTPEDVKGSFASIVDVAQAARSLVQGDFQAAFKHLKDAGAALPPAVVEKAIMKAASYLPETGPSGIMRSLLTDRGFVQQLVENPALKAAFDKMVSGSFEQGLKDVLGNPQFRDAAAGALANNADFMRRLSQFGITSAADISAVGKGIVDLMKAGEAVAQGDVGGALSAIGQAIRDCPAGVKTKVLTALADKLHLPDWAKTAIVGLGGLIGNEDIARSLGNAVSAFGRGDIGGFIAGLASTGSLIAKQDPQLAVGFLDGLSHLPGTMGKLFADHELNGMLVQSGSMGHAFDALGKAARGDLSGAVDELTKAATSLLTAGEHFKVLGKELPFGMQGAKALGKLFERFVDAMPPSVKERILKEAAKIGARNVLNFIPFIGPVLNGVGDGKQLWDDLHKQPRDNVKIAIDAAQLGIDVASLVPGLNAVTTPLKMALGAIRVVKGAADFIGDLNEFKRAFTGIGQ